MLDMRVLIAGVGLCIALVAISSLFSSTSHQRTVAGDIIVGLTLVLGLLTVVTAPVLSGLITYSRVGRFEFTWWW